MLGMRLASRARHEIQINRTKKEVVAEGQEKKRDFGALGRGGPRAATGAVQRLGRRAAPPPPGHGFTLSLCGT